MKEDAARRWEYLCTGGWNAGTLNKKKIIYSEYSILVRFEFIDDYNVERFMQLARHNTQINTRWTTLISRWSIFQIDFFMYDSNYSTISATCNEWCTIIVGYNTVLHQTYLPGTLDQPNIAAVKNITVRASNNGNTFQRSESVELCMPVICFLKKKINK